jgi:CheY-like chemotaxis protein
VRLESAVGKGATFLFEFKGVPISAAMPEEDRLASPEANLDRLRPSLILVVDDVALNRELMHGFFEGTRHRLIYASSGAEGIKMTKKFRPDLILMDMRMPDLDGHETRRAIQEDADLEKIPMIAVTASSLLAEEVNLRKVFEGYLRKPITRALLFAEMARLLPKERARETVSPVTAEWGEVSLPADLGRWRALSRYLRGLEKKIWPTLSKTMGVREMEGFAHDLLDHSKAAGCPPLADYAGKLLAEVQAIDIHGQEQTMHSFPEIVAAIERLIDKSRS